MKILFLVSLLFLSADMYAQKPHVIKDEDQITLTPGDHTTTPEGIIIAMPSGLDHKTDTVKIVLLVSDTSQYKGYYTSVYYTNPLTRAQQENHSVSWIFGYAARKATIEKKGLHQKGDTMWIDKEDVIFFEEDSYLDDEKRPLPPTIVVWKVIFI